MIYFLDEVIEPITENNINFTTMMPILIAFIVSILSAIIIALIVVKKSSKE